MQRVRFAATLRKARFLPHKEVRETVAGKVAVGAAIKLDQRKGQPVGVRFQY